MGNQQLEAFEKAHARLGVLFSTITRSDTEQISSNAKGYIKLTLSEQAPVRVTEKQNKL